MSRSCSKKTLGTRAWRAAQAAASAGGMSEKRAGRAAPPANSVIYADLITSKRAVNSTALRVEAAPFSCFGGARYTHAAARARFNRKRMGGVQGNAFSGLWNRKIVLKRNVCEPHAGCSATQKDKRGQQVWFEAFAKISFCLLGALHFRGTPNASAATAVLRDVFEPLFSFRSHLASLPPLSRIVTACPSPASSLPRLAPAFRARALHSRWKDLSAWMTALLKVHGRQLAIP